MVSEIGAKHGMLENRGESVALSARVGQPRKMKPSLHIEKANGDFSRECVLWPH